MSAAKKIVYLDCEKSEVWYVTKEALSESRFRVLRALVENIDRPVSRQRLAVVTRRSEETIRSYIKSFNRTLKAFFGRESGPITSPYGEEVWRLEGDCELLPSVPGGAAGGPALNRDQLFVLMQMHQYALAYSLTFKMVNWVESFDRTGVFDFEAFLRDLRGSIEESRNRCSVFEAQGISDFEDYFAAVYPLHELEHDARRAEAIIKQADVSAYERLVQLRQLLDRSHADLTRKHMDVVADAAT